MENVFNELNSINVNNYVEEKKGLSYLSWSFAWAEIKKRCPNASYIIKKFGENQLPYVYDDKTGYMVFTEMTIDGVTHEMWLPVMDGANKAMLDHEYTYKTKNGEKQVEKATMFDINKTIMRCLVKNIAMFGLGLYIYAGEDLPEEEKIGETFISKEQLDKLIKVVGDRVDLIKELLKEFGYEKSNQILNKDYDAIMSRLYTEFDLEIGTEKPWNK